MDEKRSKAVGIKMRSLHCTLEDIKHALYSLDFTKVDVDSLQSLAEMRATEEELNKIRQHLKEHPNGRYVCLSVSLSAYLSVYISVFLSISISLSLPPLSV